MGEKNKLDKLEVAGGGCLLRTHMHVDPPVPVMATNKALVQAPNLSSLVGLLSEESSRAGGSPGGQQAEFKRFLEREREKREREREGERARKRFCCSNGRRTHSSTSWKKR